MTTQPNSDAINIQWGNPDQTVIRLTIGDVYEYEHLRRTIESARVMLEQSPWPVHLILDAQRLKLPLSMIEHLEELAWRRSWVSPQIGVVIVVGAQGFMRHLCGLFGRMFGAADRRTLYADSLDEAMDLVDYASSVQTGPCAA
ncbi:MAG: hypothetical protein GYB68_09000 [Chloroflexi bacterium]|nr:hypothetical protein [Chloroflexota bacterium]